MQVSLRTINADNVWDILNLKVAPEQANFVAPNEKSLAQARYNDKAWYRGIYAGEEPVGFIMIYENPEGKEPEYYLWRLMIADGQQGKGYGFQAMELAIEHVKQLPRAYKLGTSYVPGPGCPEEFYRKLGFLPTGEEDEGELVMVLTWGEAPPERPDISLRPVTADNMGALVKLEVGDKQKDLVTANIDSMAESLVYPHLKSWGVYLGDEPVGFVMLEEDGCKDSYFLWRLMVADGLQCKGYGQQAMEAIIEYLRRRTNATELRTSCEPGVHGPEGFYLGLGFEPNGEILEEEAVLVLKL